jgi:hypothetical protein
VDIANFESGSPSLGNAICQCICASEPKVNKIQQKLTTITANHHTVTISTEHCLIGKVNVYSGIQEIPCILWHPNVHKRDHYRPSLIPISRQLNAVQTVPSCTVCPTRYRTRHFFNNSNTNEDIATKFEHEYVRCVRNEKECVRSSFKFRCNILISGKIIKEMPGSVASGTHGTIQVHLNVIHLRRGLPSCLFFSGVHIKTWHKLFFVLMRATCSAHLILIVLSLLTVRANNKYWSSSLCNFLQFPLIPSLLKVKVKFTLEQATKVKRWSRGIDLLFL